MPSPRLGGLALLSDRVTAASSSSSGSTSGARLLGSGAPASVGKTPSSSSAALGLRNGGSSSGRGSPSSSGSSGANGAGHHSHEQQQQQQQQQRHIGSVPDDWPMYSSQPDDYVMGPVIGFGASSTVYQAQFRPLQGRACAVKVIDLEAFGRDTEELRRETQVMSLSKHPNVLRVRGCWVQGSKLHIATRLMSSGSMLDIMRFGWSEGFDEVVIATVLRQALEGLNYLHINGWLHRDLKAANMLVDDDGTVLLGDFGVGVYLGEEPRSSKSKAAAGGGAATAEAAGPSTSPATNIDEGWAEGKRKSFVGTPCWMAPEVVERKGYGTKADVWSFGITALELTQGRAPYSRLSPVKVLMKTLQEDPPMLDRTGGAHKYSKVFEDFVRLCLQKDPAKRPSAERLLQHAFFRQAKSKKHLVGTILAGLPPLSERQERRRAMSIASLRKQASWDFGSISSRGGGGAGSHLLNAGTPLHERFDPFSNFSGVVASSSTGSAAVSPSGSAYASPQGSLSRASTSAVANVAGLPHHRPSSLVSTMKLVSIDGQHAFVEEQEADIDELAESWRKSSGDNDAGKTHLNNSKELAASSPNRVRANSAGKRTSRGASAPIHRQSMSLDDDAVQEQEEEDGAAHVTSNAESSPLSPAPIEEERQPSASDKVENYQSDGSGGPSSVDLPLDDKRSAKTGTRQTNGRTVSNSTIQAEKASASKESSSGKSQAASTSPVNGRSGGSGTTSVLGKLFRTSAKDKDP